MNTANLRSRHNAAAAAKDLQEQTAATASLPTMKPLNRDLFGASTALTALIINDYTVLAGTQGYFHHRKIDRMLGVAAQRRLPIIMYTEGSGGRPGDTDVLISGGGLNVPTFHRWCALAGQGATDSRQPWLLFCR